jgi:hypothetical protein
MRAALSPSFSGTVFSGELDSLNERVDDGASHLLCRRSSVRTIKG